MYSNKNKFDYFFILKSQKEADFSKEKNQINKNGSSNKFEFKINDELFKNKRSSKSNLNSKDINKETTIDSFETSYRHINNNKKSNLNLSQSLQTGTLNTIEEKYYKYKNFENPFTIPDIPISPTKARRSKIINKINKERMSFQSKSVDKAIYNKKILTKSNSHLTKNLFVDDSV